MANFSSIAALTTKPLVLGSSKEGAGLLPAAYESATRTGAGVNGGA
jgi:hypothetical protein